MFGYGAGKWDDQAKVYANYESIIAKGFWAPPQLSALFAYALRGFLFQGGSRTPQDLLTLLKRLSGEQSSYYKANLLIPVGHMEKILARMASSDYAVVARKAAGLIKGLYTHEIEYASFCRELNSLYNSAAKRDVFWAASCLAHEENWFLHPWVAAHFQKANADFLRLDLVEMKKAALRMGPFYNPIDPDNGLPILGEWSPPSRSEDDANVQKHTLGYYTPPPGITAIHGIQAEYGGSIQFICEEHPEEPAKLLPEDFDVVTALVFGDPRGPIWPSLSLEPKYAGLLDDDYKVFEAQIWEPSWLGNTAFGTTLSVVDWLTGTLTWNPKAFTISEPAKSFDPKFPALTAEFLEDLRFTGGLDRQTQSRLINVSPENIPMLLTKKVNEAGKEIWEVPIYDIKMRVNGSYVQELGDVEDRSISRNDARFGQGRLTQRLTEHYNDIALMMPVFERARQMMGLLYSVMKLREEGCRPHPEVQAEYSNTLRKFQGMPPLSRNRLIIKSPPFRVDFV